MTTTQKHAPVSVHCKLGDERILLAGLTWTERLGNSFDAELQLLSEDANIDLASLLKQPIAVRIERPGGSSLWLHGFVSRLESLGPSMRLHRYRAHLTSSIGLLKHTGGCRIFQDFNVLDIVKKLFSEHGMSGQLEIRTTQSYPVRSYCVQYGESNSQFIHRLIEEEGLYYFFEYSENKHTMVLLDDVSGHRLSPGHTSVEYREVIPHGQDEYLSNFESAKEFGTGLVSLNDYDFEKPRSPLIVKQKSLGIDSDFEWYDFPGRYTESDHGQRLARVRLEAEEAGRSWIRLTGNCRGLRCGQLFHLKDHSLEAANTQYLVTSAHLTLAAPSLQSNDPSEFQCSVSVTCQPTKIPYRSPQLSVRPAMRGPHVATVCGKAGKRFGQTNTDASKSSSPGIEKENLTRRARVGSELLRRQPERIGEPCRCLESAMK